MTFFEMIENQMQARIGWRKARDYAEDVVSLMERLGITVSQRGSELPLRPRTGSSL